MRVKDGLVCTMLPRESVTSRPSWVASNTAAAWRRWSSLLRWWVMSRMVPVIRTGLPPFSQIVRPRVWTQR
ncbi:hypothetical protein D3C76_997640 [compost metagenome]